MHVQFPFSSGLTNYTIARSGPGGDSRAECARGRFLVKSSRKFAKVSALFTIKGASLAVSGWYPRSAV